MQSQTYLSKFVEEAGRLYMDSAEIIYYSVSIETEIFQDHIKFVFIVLFIN